MTTILLVILLYVGLQLALGVWVNPNWFWLTAFAGLNLLQSGFTGFCLPEIVLKKLGVGCPVNKAEARA